MWDTVAFLETTATFTGHTDLVQSVCWADLGNGSQTLFSASQVFAFFPEGSPREFQSINIYFHSRCLQLWKVELHQQKFLSKQNKHTACTALPHPICSSCTSETYLKYSALEADAPARFVSLADTLCLQDRTVRQWDVRDSLCTSVLRLQQPATVAAWCPGSGLLAVGDELGSLTFFDVRKGSVQLASLHKLHHDAVRAIAAPAQGTHQAKLNLEESNQGSAM